MLYRTERPPCCPCAAVPLPLAAPSRVPATRKRRVDSLSGDPAACLRVTDQRDDARTGRTRVITAVGLCARSSKATTRLLVNKGMHDEGKEQMHACRTPTVDKATSGRAGGLPLLCKDATAPVISPRVTNGQRRAQGERRHSSQSSLASLRIPSSPLPLLLLLASTTFSTSD